jgi:class 3 adenylate cyclase
MTAQIVKRKLTAIFSADGKGYSRLMCKDGAGTLPALTEYIEIMAAS